MEARLDLIVFLRARLAEDEAVARAAGAGLGPAWTYNCMCVIALAEGDQVATGSQDALEAERGDHIARHDPARVLREVEAKRALADDYERFVAERRRMMDGWDSYPEISPVLTAFAAIYADHPDYREEWRP
ncbi:DUF6221 family protein [Streptomyces sp. NPDC059578]|uniref:DUF6221 family protein n=1 Tax=Streptomyces sp. NPDC059578 TaxID=3346874 RepID=UPI0036763B2A